MSAKNISGKQSQHHKGDNDCKTVKQISAMLIKINTLYLDSTRKFFFNEGQKKADKIKIKRLK